MRKISVLMSALLLLCACQNELYRNPLNEHKADQGVYIKQAGALQTFIEEHKAQEINDVKLGLTNKSDKEIKVGIEAGNSEQLEVYNKKNGTSYIMLPAEMYEPLTEATFAPKRATTNVPIKLKDVTFSSKGTYALPLRLYGRDASVVTGQSELMLIFEQRLVTKSLHMAGYEAKYEDMFPEGLNVDQWTLEVMVNRQQYLYNNRAICGTVAAAAGGVSNEIYIRFGDVTIDHNQLQIKTGGSQIDIPKDKLAAQPGVWYMLSFVYDGKMTRVYVDGELAVEREIRTGAYGLTGFWLGGANELIREVRFYKTARTSKQIGDHLWKMVDPTDDDLLLYYPLNGKKYDPATGEITEDESKVWDWSKSQKHMNMSQDSYYDNNGGMGFVFPPTAK